MNAALTTSRKVKIHKYCTHTKSSGNLVLIIYIIVTNDGFKKKKKCVRACMRVHDNNHSHRLIFSAPVVCISIAIIITVNKPLDVMRYEQH